MLKYNLCVHHVHKEHTKSKVSLALMPNRLVQMVKDPYLCSLLLYFLGRQEVSLLACGLCHPCALSSTSVLR
jgi:hypothetical protein